MAQVNHLFDKNFLEYASYVIRDRAIPDIDDGLKPVQRRILYTLYKMDDGTLHKVAGVVGDAMKLHPHGDASIYEALVNLANKDLFIEKQGNFGNIFTGDGAAAARYIECALAPLAKEILFRDELTEFVPSYDGKNKEPVSLPAKIPLGLVLGAEGIAVGMSTKILPHNFVETAEAMRSALAGADFTLLPDFPTGGLVDCSGYADGLGRVICRAKLDLSDPKRVVVRELPFGTTVESLIQSIEDAARKGKIKIGAINDYTAENVEVEIDLPRGVYAKDMEAALYAFTACENSITVNSLFIKDRKPGVVTITEAVRYHSHRLVELLRKELEFEKNGLLDKIRSRTLERIFIEERVYKLIEEVKTAAAVDKTVKDGLKPFEGKEFTGAVNDGDVAGLLAIPIRRISLFDINKNRKELAEMEKRVSAINANLTHIKDYATNYLDKLIAAYSAKFPRKTTLINFKRVDVRDAAMRNLKLKYDRATGYLGVEIASGTTVAEVSGYDRVLIINADTSYRVIEVPPKLFIGKDALFAGLADREETGKTVFNVAYKNLKNGHLYLKRFTLGQFILGKIYTLILPEETALLAFVVGDAATLTPEWAQKSLLKEELFDIKDYEIKGVRERGTRIKAKEVLSATFISKE